MIMSIRGLIYGLAFGVLFDVLMINVVDEWRRWQTPESLAAMVVILGTIGLMAGIVYQRLHSSYSKQGFAGTSSHHRLRP